MADEYDPGMDFQSWRTVANMASSQKGANSPGLLAGLLGAALLGKKSEVGSVIPQAAVPTTGLKMGNSLDINPSAPSGLGIGIQPPAKNNLVLPNLSQTSPTVPQSLGQSPVSSPSVSSASPSPSFDLKGFIGKLFPGTPS